MQSIIHYTMFVLILMLVSACATVFNDDFEADPAGGAPLAQPAGGPDDSLSFAEGPGSVTVTNVLPLVGGQSLFIRGPSEDGTPIVHMFAAPITALSQPVYVFWQGRLSSGARVQIKVFSGVISKTTIIMVNLEDGIVFVEGDSVGNYSVNSQHGIQIGLFPDNDQYRLTVTGDADVPGTVVGTLWNLDAFPTGHLGLQVELLPGAENLHSYRMDEVVISHKN